MTKTLEKRPCGDCGGWFAVLKPWLRADPYVAGQHCPKEQGVKLWDVDGKEVPMKDWDAAVGQELAESLRNEAAWYEEVGDTDDDA